MSKLSTDMQFLRKNHQSYFLYRNGLISRNEKCLYIEEKYSCTEKLVILNFQIQSVSQKRSFWGGRGVQVNVINTRFKIFFNYNISTYGYVYTLIYFDIKLYNIFFGVDCFENSVKIGR